MYVSVLSCTFEKYLNFSLARNKNKCIIFFQCDGKSRSSALNKSNAFLAVKNLQIVVDTIITEML